MYGDEQLVVEETFKKMKARMGEEVFQAGGENDKRNKPELCVKHARR